MLLRNGCNVKKFGIETKTKVNIFKIDGDYVN